MLPSSRSISVFDFFFLSVQYMRENTELRINDKSLAPRALTIQSNDMKERNI